MEFILEPLDDSLKESIEHIDGSGFMLLHMVREVKVVPGVAQFDKKAFRVRGQCKPLIFETEAA